MPLRWHSPGQSGICHVYRSHPVNPQGHGKVFWIQYTVIQYVLYGNAAVNISGKIVENCPDLPCVRFMKDPTISDEENEANLKKMIDNLSEFVK